MNQAQRDLIPSKLLRPSAAGCADLVEWLHARGWCMTLAELAEERKRRGIRGPR